MKIKQFPYDNFNVETSIETLEAAFHELFQRELITMEGFSLSMRSADGFLYLDTADVPRLLWDETETDAQALQERTELRRIHEVIYDQIGEIRSVITSRPPLVSLHLDGGIPFGHSTSMLRKRGVEDINNCVYAAGALQAEQLPDTLAAAQQRARDNGMAHLLMLVRQGMMVVCGQNLFEAMAHGQNIEYCAHMEHAGNLYQTAW